MKITKILAGIITLLVIISVTLSNHSLEYSEVVADLSSDITSLEHANTILSAEIAERGSLTAAAERISSANFEEPENIATLSGPGQVALR